MDIYPEFQRHTKCQNSAAVDGSNAHEIEGLATARKNMKYLININFKVKRK